MAYPVTGDTVGLALGPVSETANDVHEVLGKARQMYETGLANVSIEDDAGHKIDGDELLDCITGKRRSPRTFRQNRVVTNSTNRWPLSGAGGSASSAKGFRSLTLNGSEVCIAAVQNIAGTVTRSPSARASTSPVRGDRVLLQS
jgi:hypothetical protein